MSNVIILPWLTVENANAVAGLTWGFPAITHFLGYTHALSRKLQASHGLRLEGCAVICHHHQVHAYSSGRDYQFALTRNPLTREGKTASFNEEGRMHLTVSLLLECEGEIPNGEIGMRELASHMQTLCQTQKLAGGTITGLRNVQVRSFSKVKSMLYGLMPGFVLTDRSSLLDEHYQQLRQLNPEAEMIDSWLDFAALKMVAEGGEQAEDAAIWNYQAKPFPGYLVPLMTGWQRISMLYEPGTVTSARDEVTPFCFAEAVYGVGEWQGVHRIKDLKDVLWRYHTTESGYYCRGQELPNDEQDEDEDPRNFDNF
ncbi:type I-F CRISPR-associated protein Csy2 [Enterobacter sp. R1(2018)]|uniref:type I-F CRISPR-associated protein Csy2 n=1 Tax=Enterobacter sp. R1(2018) TaxID=2447891 RepID=UPI000EAE95AF|nr:type I-F CRISPR-associated protein Csy2 [Enterobacter sp. R1(2018)]RKQ41018.1 type I-F CRISPR-associated protein Csy2 [Enterobacter sp. R1(2018)]